MLKATAEKFEALGVQMNDPAIASDPNRIVVGRPRSTPA